MDENLQNSSEFLFQHARSQENGHLVTGADTSVTMSRGEQELYRAVKNGNINSVRLLLDHGANPNLKDVDSVSLLQWAVRYTNKEMVQVLLEHGADPNITNSHGDSPLHYAIRYLSGGIVRMLLASGADPNLKGRDGFTALHTASIGDVSKYCHVIIELKKPTILDMIKALLEAGSDPSIIDKYGRTALHLAKSQDIVLCLLENGAPIDAQDNEGQTPLHLSATKNSSHSCSICTMLPLLFAGANLDIRDNKGLTFKDILFQNNSGLFELFSKLRIFKIKKYIIGCLDDPGYSLSEQGGFEYFSLKELTKLKSTSVAGVCLYDILKWSLKDFRFLKNLKLRSIIQEGDFKRQFPRTYIFIRISVWKAQQSQALVEELSVVLSTKLRSVLILNVPAEVCRLIITELDIQDLENLKLALQ